MSKQVIDTLLAAGQVKLVEQLRALEPEGPVQAMVIKALADAVDQHGLAGVALVSEKLSRILDGEKGVELDLSDLRLASDTLAALQQLEAEERSAARDLLTRATKALGPVVSAVLGMVV